MVLDWLSRLAQRAVKESENKVAALPAGPVVVDAKTSAPRMPTAVPPSAAPVTWWQFLFRSMPLAMGVVGLLLSAVTHLVGLWAILGYLLVAMAPSVFLLQRIERRLADLYALWATMKR